MRPGRPIQMTLSITEALPATQVVSLVDAAGNTIEDLPNGVVNVPKHKRFVGNGAPDAQPQDLAGPNWSGGPFLTGRNVESPRVGGRTRSISIRNMHAVDALQVSFDRGVNFFTLLGGATGGESFADEVSLQFFTVRRSTATAASGAMPVEIMIILV